MPFALLWLVLLVGTPLAGLLFFYNRFVRHANRVKEAWSGIDVQLKRRHNLIPRLVEAVKAYARHESALLEELARKRTESMAARGLQDLEEREQSLSRSLQPVLALAEAYPELKADKPFGRLQAQLVEVEDTLQMARRYYNGSVRDYNTAVETFPGNLAAALFRFRSREFFEIDTATERMAPRVRLDGQGSA